MRKKQYTVAISLVLLLITSTSLLAMTTAWEEEEKRPATAIDSQFLAGKHVVFVAGFMNELTRIIDNYFDDNMAAVKQLGGKYSSIKPSSRLCIIENAALMYNRIVRIAHQEQKPLILIGHSKGGAEILFMLFQHPDLILNGYVERALLIQPAIGGSLLAQNASGILFSLVSLLFNPDTLTLSKHPAKRILNATFKLYKYNLNIYANKHKLKVDDLHKCLSTRIFYLRSSAGHNLSFGLKLILGVLQDSPDNYSDQHDGLLDVEDQYDPRIGIDLGILEGIDHIDLTVSTVSNLSPSRRQAATRASLKIMYAKEPFYIYAGND